ncbi:MAG: MBL fold metallo-hydrolase [Deltaproteobacteria bacterium]|nr:MAG: MBL fold metallo-hydrolase [Deltaproteobacteria bacterium]
MFTNIGNRSGLFSAFSNLSMGEDFMLERVLDKLLWLGHSSFIYEGEPLIYFDPFALRHLRPADLILVSHDHPHHCSPVDIDKVRRTHTVILADEHTARHINPPVIAMAPGQRETVGDFLIEALPAYNLHMSFHPRQKAHLGFIVTLEGLRLYHAGDTDFIPEMRDFDVDIALLPISGFNVMDAEEAAQAALALHPQVAIPMHYGTDYGTLEDAMRFRALLDGKIRVEILSKS